MRVHRLLGEQDWEGSRRSREGELEGLDPREVRDTLEGTDQSFTGKVQNLQISDSRLQTLDFRLHTMYPRLSLFFLLIIDICWSLESGVCSWKFEVSSSGSRV